MVAAVGGVDGIREDTSYRIDQDETSIANQGMMTKHFTTKFGHQIKLIDGYYDAHTKRVNAKNYLAQESSRPENRGVIGYKPVQKDIFMYCMMIDFLRSHGITTQWQSSLDVGGAEGAIARLHKLEGRVKRNHVIELYDMRTCLPVSRFLKYVMRHKIESRLCRLGVLDKSRISDPYRFDQFNYYPNGASSFFNVKVRKSPSIDSYTLCDFYETKGAYDLITAFSVIDYFDPERFFAKASDLLMPGGIMFAYLSYWWFPVNAALVYGDFPYASQRLTKDDFERYLKEFRSDKHDNTMELYNYFHLGNQKLPWMTTWNTRIVPV